MGTKPAITKPLSVEDAIGRIKRGLESRSQKQWSITRSKGRSSFEWLQISSPLKRRDGDMLMRADDRLELATLLDMHGIAPEAGYLVQCRGTNLHEYVSRAEGSWGK